DWGLGLDARLNTGNKVQLIPIEAYVKGKIGIFQMKAGRSKDMSGLVDSTLSVGSFAISGNALGIPKVEISIPEFYAIPFTNGVVSFKGSFVHGWMGKALIQYGANDGESVPTFFHHKSLHGRFGKPDWKVRIYAGVNHEVIWGSDKYIFGNQYNLSGVDAFWHVITGKKYVKHGLKRDISKIGNHLGAIDLGMDFRAGDVLIFAYRQQFYDKGALYYLANIKDGLTGLSIKNNRPKSDRSWHWNKFLVEFFYSKNQAGEKSSKETPSGPEYYYNHAVYTEGYSYKGLGLGTPLITTAGLARQNLPNDPINFFSNNRVSAFHFGMEGYVKKWKYVARLTYSTNYGDYRTSDIPFWYNGDRYERVPGFGIFNKVKQFSGLIEASRFMRNGYSLGISVAVDQGKLLYNTTGGSLKISKVW
ncbi:MAG TPA: capsule assembly Wzi family protein, partial [Dyadobacter sp.]|nr:capsule assembly Wzi family protein [Dyadobacter sp.]